MSSEVSTCLACLGTGHRKKKSQPTNAKSVTWLVRVIKSGVLPLPWRGGNLPGSHWNIHTAGSPRSPLDRQLSGRVRIAQAWSCCDPACDSARKHGVLLTFSSPNMLSDAPRLPFKRKNSMLLKQIDTAKSKPNSLALQMGYF